MTPAIQLIYTEVKEALKGQLEEVKTANTKAQVTLGFTGILMINLASVKGAFVSTVVWVACGVLSLVLAFLAYQTQNFATSVKLDWFRDTYLQAGDDLEARQCVIDSTLEYLEQNRKIVRRKNRLLSASLVAFGLAALVLAAERLMLAVGVLKVL